jgi:decaprenylphospho-beta-D-erythro-pentofuranosid-2-ulose 2-reductase
MNESRYQAAVFGATSAIATALLREIAASGPCHLLLLGRDARKLDTLAADLRARGADCDSHEADLLDPDANWDQLLSSRVWDLCLIAHGSLPDQELALTSGPLIAREIAVNYTSHVVIAAACVRCLEIQQRGTLAVIGSVAGDRGRKSNFLYGSAKAGIETFCRGLQHRFADRPNIQVVLLKPGMTDTPMTADLSKGLLFSPAEKVGRLAWEAIRNAMPVAYLPGFWRPVMTMIRWLPARIFNRTRL